MIDMEALGLTEAGTPIICEFKQAGIAGSGN